MAHQQFYSLIYRFEALNEDVLQLILDELQGHRTTVSLVSRFLRDLCMPIIFKHVVWGSMPHSTSGPPLNIWPYVQ